ncbi:MAG: hypothetical protein ABIE84_01165 [bacterium]
MKKGLTFAFIGLLIVGCLLLVNSCASLANFSFASRGTTSLTSNSLAAASALRAQGITIAGTAEGGNWYITPTKISGKILSVVLPFADEEDDGLTPFGAGRPDIAPAESELFDFDLSNVTTLTKESITLKDTSVGGDVNQILLIFGYFDVEFLQGTTTKKLRFCYGDTAPYLRGDLLLYNPTGEATGSYYWYSSTEGFVIESGTRPSDAVTNNLVATFQDDIRPNMHYYMLGANLVNCTDHDGTIKDGLTIPATLVEENNLAFTVDFDVENSVYFYNVASDSAFQALTDAQLIQKFDMKQNVSDWGDTGLECSITFEAVPK